MSRTRTTWLACLLVALAAPAPAQMGGRHPPMGPPAFLHELFIPEQIMRHQDDIALTADQRQTISAEMAETQKKLVDLQWQFESASKKLTDMLRAPRVDQDAVMAQADAVLALELQMKRTHLGLLVKIKNVLTADQQAKLRELTATEPSHFGPPPR
jgi:Spy/CpxP family protein refolding chaperone